MTVVHGVECTAENTDGSHLASVGKRAEARH